MPQATRLERIVQYAKAPNNPWLLIHGIRAMGPDFAIVEQGLAEHEYGKAIDYLCSHYLRNAPVAGATYLYMPIDYEHHPHCFLSEAVLDAGVPLEYAFESNGGNHSVADLVTSARALFQFNGPSSERDTSVGDTLAWSLTAFAHVTDPADDTWVNAYGHRIRFRVVVESAMAILERATRHLQTAMINRRHEPLSDEIHEFACAGTHLTYGLTTCLKFGYHEHGLAERMKSQFNILIWRLQNDLKLVDNYYDQLGGDYPADVSRMYRLDTKLKFLGHAFEIINYIKKYQLFKSTAAQEEIIEGGRQTLNEVIGEIASDGIEKYAEDNILFNLLVGDACHAFHGITMGAK